MIKNEVDVLKTIVLLIENPPEESRKKMYNWLYNEGKVIISFEDFSESFSNPEELLRFHYKLKKDNLIDGDYKSFKQEYFGDIYKNKQIDQESLSTISLEDTKMKIKELDSLLLEKQKQLKKFPSVFSKRKIRWEYTIYVFTIMSGILYPIRFLILATIWSIKTLKSEQ